MDKPSTKNWINDHIWPQIHGLMLNDAYFKLVRRFYEMTGKYNEPIGNLVVNGHVTYQMIGIRRLCDPRRDVISLRADPESC